MVAIRDCYSVVVHPYAIAPADVRGSASSRKARRGLTMRENEAPYNHLRIADGYRNGSWTFARCAILQRWSTAAVSAALPQSCMSLNRQLAARCACLKRNWAFDC